jgi:hypothetical protein
VARTVRKSGVTEVPLSEIKDDLSCYLREAETQEIVITRHGKIGQFCCVAETISSCMGRASTSIIFA